MQSKRSFWLIVLLALPTLACQSVFDGIFRFDGAAQTPAGQWPQSRFVAAQQAVSPAGSPQILAQAELAAVRAAAFSPLPPIPGESYMQVSTTRPTPPPLPQAIAKIDKNQLAQIDTLHISNDNLQSIQIFINGQPVVAAETIQASSVLPDTLLDVKVCTDYQWFNTGLDYVQVCSKEGVAKINQVNPSDPYPTKQQRLTLIVQGRQVGVYNLRLVTIDAAGKTQEINHLIEVID